MPLTTRRQLLKILNASTLNPYDLEYTASKGWHFPLPESPLRRKKRLERERKQRELRAIKYQQALEREAIPAIIALVAKGQLLVTKDYMKTVTNHWQREALVKAICLAKIRREQ